MSVCFIIDKDKYFFCDFEVDLFFHIFIQINNNLHARVQRKVSVS